jgi:hypothetical protein
MPHDLTPELTLCPQIAFNLNFREEQERNAFRRLDGKVFEATLLNLMKLAASSSMLLVFCFAAQSL